MHIPKKVGAVALTFILVLQSAVSQNYEGQTKTIEYYNASADTKESFKTIWFCSSMQDYSDKEINNFNTHHTAFHTDDLSKIADGQELKMLDMLHIKSGMYHGYYYPLKARRVKDNVEHTYMSYIAIPLKTYNIHINFVGVQRQYILNYDLEIARENKEKLAVFRIPSGQTRYEEDYKITAQVTPEDITIKAVYNHQTLTLTMTPKENLFLTYMRKWGFNDRILINIADSTTTLTDSIQKIADQD